MADFACVRCGRHRWEHDTNLVLESEEVWLDLEAKLVVPGYELCLLDCCETKRPAAYTQQIQENCYSVGNGAGYISPDPKAEDQLRREQGAMAVGGTFVCIALTPRGSRAFDAGL